MKKRYCPRRKTVMENPSQTLVDQTVSKGVANSKQTLSKHCANIEQTLSKNIEQTVSKRCANIEQTLSKNIKQTLSKHTSEHCANVEQDLYRKSFSMLSKSQKKIVEYICHLCANSRSIISPEITIDELAGCSNMTKMSAQNAMYRLEKLGIVKKIESKTGCQGWRRYEVRGDVYEHVANIEQTLSKRCANIHQNIEQTPCSSSSSINTTTTGELEKANLSGIKPHGFLVEHTQSITRALCEKGLPMPSLEAFQLSIDNFASDMKANPSGMKDTFSKSGPLRGFMGVLKRGEQYVKKFNLTSKEQTIYVPQPSGCHWSDIEVNKNLSNKEGD